MSQNNFANNFNLRKWMSRTWSREEVLVLKRMIENHYKDIPGYTFKPSPEFLKLLKPTFEKKIVRCPNVKEDVNYGLIKKLSHESQESYSYAVGFFLDSLKDVLYARKTSFGYNIYTNIDCDEKNKVAELKRSSFGRKYVLIENGVETMVAKFENIYIDGLLSRKITVYFDFKPSDKREKLSNRIGNNTYRDTIVLKNNESRCSEISDEYKLEFQKRVKFASKKNFLLVCSTNHKLISRFGTLKNETFSCDYFYPMTSVQSFSLGLCSIDHKPFIFF